MQTMLIVVLFTCISCVQNMTHRKHTKRTKKYNGFRKDLITHLPQSKLLDIILNRAVSEIMDSMQTPGQSLENNKTVESVTDADKRKQIAINQKDRVIDYESLSNQLKNNLRSMKKKFKTADAVMDPFDGQDDPYGLAERDSNKNLLKKEKMTELVDKIQNTGWKDIATDDQSNSKHSDRFSKQHQSVEAKIEEDSNIEDSESDQHHKKDESKSNEEHQENSKDEYRENPNDDSKDAIYQTRKKETKEDDPDNRDKVSEMLPSSNGDILLMKTPSNVKEVKLDIPNIHFDAKLNSSNARDKIVNNLKRVVGVLYQLNFPKGSSTNGDASYVPKNASLEVGDRRDGSVQSSIVSSRLDTDHPSFPDTMFPGHGSYVVEHGGNIYRIEKLHPTSITQEHKRPISADSTIEELRNPTDIVGEPGVHNNEEKNEEKGVDHQLHLASPHHRNHDEAFVPEHQVSVRKPIIILPVEPTQPIVTKPTLTSDELSSATGQEANIDVNHKHEVKDAYVIKHGGQVYKVIQTNEQNTKVNNANKLPDSISDPDHVIDAPIDDKELSNHIPLDMLPIAKVANVVPSTVPIQETPPSLLPVTNAPNADDKLPPVHNTNADNTYEIKHNNKIFRITEITSKTPQIQTDSAETRGFRNKLPVDLSNDNNTLGLSNSNLSPNEMNSTNETNDISSAPVGAYTYTKDNMNDVTIKENNKAFENEATYNNQTIAGSQFTRSAFYTDTQQQRSRDHDHDGDDNDDDEYVTYVFRENNSSLPTASAGRFDVLNTTLDQNAVP